MRIWRLLAAVPLLLGLSCSKSEITTMHVLHAGSLSVPFREAAAAFMAENPGIKVRLEAHGSRTAARQISDLGRQAEVMASADSQVIRNLLIPEHAHWCIDFATNEMVIMYREDSRYSREINADNWYRILLREGVQYGHSDPNADPCGYRTVMTWQLAARYYAIKDPLARNLDEKLRAAMPLRNLRPKEVDLIAMLEAGELDYIFIYRSVAEQHRAPFLILPDEINLKSPHQAQRYATVSVRLSGNAPGEWIEMRGTPMVYGVTLPRNAEHPALGVRFIAFLLGKEGRRIMSRNGQSSISPPRVDYPERLPRKLAELLASGE
ncbi:MAG TPA: tungstate ABC transporter substrate-binding protein WtpA [Candidatus Aminicenantes bacterium]|nr:tungstate ABC transporter substrate-binding protein WtpA [Candidatus Aminicenantes bacterium]